MVTVTLYCGQDDRVTGFEVEGHAGFAAQGEDVVCAAVSVLAQSAVIGLEYFLDPKPAVRIEEGFLSCRLPAPLPETDRIRAEAILKTMELGFTSTRSQYRKYMRIVRRRYATCD
jgi:uncharacterized protein YsxB (DUF464 family)